MSTRTGLGLALALSLAAALVYDAAASPPRIYEIKVPEPTPPPPPPPPPAPTIGPNGEVIPPPQPVARVIDRVRPGVRREVRKVEGVAPTGLWGRYDVVEVTENGETEDYRIKMEREGKALDQDCITVRMVFDFGPTEGALPPVLQVAEQQQCSKGGLGTYDSELALALPATWTQGDGGAILALPGVHAESTLVRVRKPETGDLHTPSHWLGPETKVERPATQFKVVAEIPKPRRDTDPPLPPTAIHLIGPDAVWHLEPEPPDSPFAR